MHADFHNRSGVSRTNIIVVLIVLAVMLALLLPAIRLSRESARKGLCQHNLKELGLGVLNFEQANKAFPAGTVVLKALPPEKRLSWYVACSPYVLLGQEWLVIKMDEPWDSPANLRPKLGYHDAPDLSDNIEVDFRQWSLARCPSTSSSSPPQTPDVASYIGIAGLGGDSPRLPAKNPNAGIWGYDRRTRSDDLKRRAASILLLAETAFQNGPWTAGGPPTVRGIIVDGEPVLGTGRQLGGNHPGGCNVAFADLSVRFLDESIDPQALAGMATLAGGDTNDKHDRQPSKTETDKGK
jgi:prepilin-type processing-associated H-X9-DG protein